MWAGGREQFLAELAQAEKELANLTAAITAAGPLSTLVEHAKERERQRLSVTERLVELAAAAQAGAVDSKELETKLREPLKAWRALLQKHVAQARQILRKLLSGRLTFTPRTDDKERSSSSRPRAPWAGCWKGWPRNPVVSRLHKVSSPPGAA